MNESKDQQIISRWHGGQSMRGIARDLGISRHRVARTIRRWQRAREEGPRHPDLPHTRGPRKSKLDAFGDALAQFLERYPNITVTRMLEELRQLGYQGGYTILRQRMERLRQRPRKEVVVRFETAPGVQAQMDWSVYDIDFTQEGHRRVHLFGYILGYSRRQYLCFTEQEDFETTTRQHIRAFEYLQGIAAECLYDNMKVVVQRWEDDEPIYNTRFLAFATHYGYSPRACRPRTPQTKGKIERQFFFAETNLLNGRTFRTLEHLNEVTRWWLANVSDVRVHRTTKKRPLDAHAEELPLLLPLPTQHYDTARVVYRVVDVEGFVGYRNHRYSVPWKYIGRLVPLRVTEDQLLIYNSRLERIAEHRLLSSAASGQQQVDPAHRPAPRQRIRVELLEERFAEWGEIGTRYLKGLLAKRRNGKHQAGRALVLFGSYSRQDVIAALERAVAFHAYSYSSLERILHVLGTPKPPWQNCDEGQLKLFDELDAAAGIEPRPSSDYQFLLSDQETSDDLETPEEDDQKDGDSQSESERGKTQGRGEESGDPKNSDKNSEAEDSDAEDSGA